jgi:hypothetical protein
VEDRRMQKFSRRRGSEEASAREEKKRFRETLNSSLMRIQTNQYRKPTAAG